MDITDIASSSPDNVDSLLNTIDDIYQEELSENPAFPENQPAAPDETPVSDAFTGNLLSVAELEEAGFIEPQIAELTLGLEMGLPAKKYARTGYSWRQMREIRQGLYAGVDTDLYENPLYSADQMRELKMGLINHIDASVYADLMLSATDMHRIRLELSEEAYRAHPNEFGYSFPDEESGLSIRIGDDCMNAYVTVPGNLPGRFSANRIRKILQKHEITYGILTNVLNRFSKDFPRDREICVAQGIKPVTGRDGYYEYHFTKLKNPAPVINEDGSVDYSSMQVTEIVEEGQKLATYHPAARGVSGNTVSGIVLKEENGKELPPLTGDGIRFDPATNTYTAANAGNISLEEETFSLNIWESFTIENDVTRYSGKVDCDGTLVIRGDVRNMASIKATGDIVVEGSVESANLTSGHNIIIRKGVNAAGRGTIQAKGNITGSFFESANLIAGGRIEGNYFLSCKIETDDKVIAKGGKSVIQGGSLRAALGAEASYFRTYGGTKTTIEVGDIAEQIVRQQNILEEITQTTEELEKLRDGRNKLDDLLRSEPEKYRPIYQKTVLAMEQKEAHLDQLKQESERLQEVIQNTPQAYIKINHSMQAGVLIIVKGKRKYLVEDIGLNTITFFNFPEEEKASDE